VWHNLTKTLYPHRIYLSPGKKRKKMKSMIRKILKKPTKSWFSKTSVLISYQCLGSILGDQLFISSTIIKSVSSLATCVVPARSGITSFSLHYQSAPEPDLHRTMGVKQRPLQLACAIAWIFGFGGMTAMGGECEEIRSNQEP
jgi:hypothetical protein